METVFLQIVHMNLTASLLVFAIIPLRFLLKNAPKWIMGILWTFVAIRLICPFSIESTFSLIPNIETLPKDILTTTSPAINAGIEAFNQTINPIINNSLSSNVESGAALMQSITCLR